MREGRPCHLLRGPARRRPPCQCPLQDPPLRPPGLGNLVCPQMPLQGPHRRHPHPCRSPHSCSHDRSYCSPPRGTHPPPPRTRASTPYPNPDSPPSVPLPANTHPAHNRRPVLRRSISSSPSADASPSLWSARAKPRNLVLAAGRRDQLQPPSDSTAQARVPDRHAAGVRGSAWTEACRTVKEMGNRNAARIRPLLLQLRHRLLGEGSSDSAQVSRLSTLVWRARAGGRVSRVGGSRVDQERRQGERKGRSWVSLGPKRRMTPGAERASGCRSVDWVSVVERVEGSTSRR